MQQAAQDVDSQASAQPPRPPLSVDLKHRIAAALAVHGRIEPPVPGRAPLLRCRYLGSVMRKMTPMDRYEIETRVLARGRVRNARSVVEVSWEGEVSVVEL